MNETFIYDNTEIKNSKEEKILRVIIDNNYSLSLCHDSKKKVIFNALIKSQFSYCPLVWISCSRQTNNMINKIHERALRIVLNDHISDFDTMLRNINDITTDCKLDTFHALKPLKIMI